MKTKRLPMVFSFAGILVCILDTETLLTACREGIELCLYTVLPSLFPFCVFSILLSRNLQPLPLFRPLGRAFRMPPGSETILLTGILGGYPMGAQSIHGAWVSGNLSREDAQRLLMFCSQPGPAFLFGILANAFSPGQCWLLWAVLLGSAWIVALVFPGAQPATTHQSRTSPDSRKPVIAAATAAMGNICGWILLMRMLIGFLDRWVLWIFPDSIHCLISGILELTNGCCMVGNLANPQIRFILTCCMLSFGGICVLMQTKSLTSGLDIRYYIRGKLLQTLCCLSISSGLCGYWRMLLPLIVIIGWILTGKIRKNSSFPLRLGV